MPVGPPTPLTYFLVGHRLPIYTLHIRHNQIGGLALATEESISLLAVYCPWELRRKRKSKSFYIPCSSVIHRTATVRYDRGGDGNL